MQPPDAVLHEHRELPQTGPCLTADRFRAGPFFATDARGTAPFTAADSFGTHSSLPRPRPKLPIANGSAVRLTHAANRSFGLQVIVVFRFTKDGEFRQ
jgi:hypothetical protein